MNIGHQQLRCKWENLKRSAKKRNALIQENLSKEANGKQPVYIPPDDILDRVSIILKGTIEALTDQFGGDSAIDQVQLKPEFVKRMQEPEVVIEGVDTVSEFVMKREYRDADDFSEDEDIGQKKRLKLDDDGRKARNLAIAEYYAAKRRLVDATFQNLRLENDKLKLEISQYKKILSKS